MQTNAAVAELIQKAVKQAGSKSNLARAMGVAPQKINSWESGLCACVPEDRARLAGFAREDAVQELVRATLEKNEGTLRGEQLRKLMGKWLPQTIAAIVFALLIGANMTYGTIDATGAGVLFLALAIFHNVYYVKSSATIRLGWRPEAGFINFCTFVPEAS